MCEPLDLYIERVALQGVARQNQQGYITLIESLQQRLQRRTQGRRGRRRRQPTLHCHKTIQEQTAQGIKVPKRVPTRGQDETLEQATHREWNRYKKCLEAYFTIKWRKRWIANKKGRVVANYRPYPTKQALSLYKDRTKAFSSILIGLRTGKIGLQGFLSNMRVPGYESPTCDCGEDTETVEHFLLKCPRWSQERGEVLPNLAGKSLRTILNSRMYSQKAVEFVMRTKRLEQFQAVNL